jgi:indolepyruvate ferredoxin oxidoreductase
MTETAARPALSDRYTATSGRVQLTGVQALARLPIDQHRRDLAAGLNVGTFISGYEGSPLAGDDPAAKSSTLPCASDAALADMNIPYLYPADSQDVLDLGRHAIELSRASGLWVGLKIVTAMADGSSTVDLAADWPAPRLPAGAGTHAPTARLLHPTLGQLERDLVTNRLRLAKEYSRLNQLNRIVGQRQGDVLGIVAAGHTYLDVLAALGRLGIDEDSLQSSRVRLLKISMPWPLEETTVREFADGLQEIVVVEEKRSFLEAALRDILYGGPDQPAVTGKRDADGSARGPAPPGGCTRRSCGRWA